MKPVFADTSFFLALVNRRDEHHRQAAELNSSLNVPLVTTCWVLLEFANGISASHARMRFGKLLVWLREEPGVRLLEGEASFFDQGCRLFTSRPDKDWSLTTDD